MQTTAHLPEGTPIEIWFQDEARIGQKNKQVREWETRGTRPRQPADQRYQSAYIFGAVCPKTDKGAALVMPSANTEAMQLHLEEISKNVTPNAHAVIIMDGAAYHTTKKLKYPKNLSKIILPARCPELNPTENIWQFLRNNYLSRRVFENYEEILEACCEAWNKLTNEIRRITSIASREWAIVKSV